MMNTFFSETTNCTRPALAFASWLAFLKVVCAAELSKIAYEIILLPKQISLHTVQFSSFMKWDKIHKTCV